MMFDFKAQILNAQKQIESYIRETPLDYSIGLSRLVNAHVYVKCENLQYTGSFKARGAINKLLSLSQIEQRQGIVTASTGNHGAAVAYGLQKLNIPGIIFVPENASKTKIENIRNYDASLEFYGTDSVDTEIYAKEYALKHNMIYISPYNDPCVITGQGTVGLELTRQLNKIDAILVPIGGGGLIAGIAGWIKSISPDTKVIGCLPENSPVMAKSIQAGYILEMQSLPTLSDATAGGIEPGSITFEFCKRFVDDYILVSEQEIKNAITILIKTQHLLVEGASGVALAGLLKMHEAFQDKNVVVVLSGGNISVDTLKAVLI
jgi:threonine dehydratase